MPHHLRRTILPFTAIIGQDEMKQALILNAINPKIGGVLIRGEKGTAKSTAVRALAELLPEIEVVKSCPFNCDPSDVSEMCDLCYTRKAGGEVLDSVRRKVIVVDLPLGVTEDRLVGTIDIERAIKEGIKALEPGILAKVHRGILYIDEINLLDDHAADILLDSAAMGINVIEREGISLSHPSRFILIGTMNPEEGELRPQLLDRFGLQVNVEGIEDVSQRMEIVKTAERFETNPDIFRSECREQTETLKARITRAKTLLPYVTVKEELLRATVESCISLGIRTHRAEIAVIRTARTIAAYGGRNDVSLEDIEEAMAFALPHRMRRKPFEEPRLNRDELKEALEKSMPHTDSKMDTESEDEQAPAPQQHSEHGTGDREGSSHSGNIPETVFGVGDPIDLPQIKQKEFREHILLKSGKGRRNETLSARPHGRYSSSRYPTAKNDIALDATLRAAAPYQRERSSRNLAVAIRDQDIREKVRVGKVPTACLFVVDASGSMGALKRMECTKGAILSMLQDSYVHRDRVGMVAFRGNDADLILPLCSSTDLALRRLRDIPTGGKTPLSKGLIKGMELLLLEKKKNIDIYPQIVLLSDGRANVSLNGDIRKELIDIAGDICCNNIHSVIIDTESVSGSFIQNRLGYCRMIAEHAQGSYYSIDDLTPDAVRHIVEIEKAMMHGK